MAHTTFDTLKIAKDLEAAGISVKHAEAFVKAQKDSLNEALETSVATKNDINDLKHSINDLKADNILMKWMLGFLLAGIFSLVIKAFF